MLRSGRLRLTESEALPRRPVDGRQVARGWRGVPGGPTDRREAARVALPAPGRSAGQAGESLGAVATALGNAGADISASTSSNATRNTRSTTSPSSFHGRPGRVDHRRGVGARGGGSRSGPTPDASTPIASSPSSRRSRTTPRRASRCSPRVCRLFRASWAIVVVREGTAYRLAQSAAAPETTAADLPWLPLERTVVIDPEVQWVPGAWTALDTDLAAAPLGLAPRASSSGGRVAPRSAVRAGPPDPPDRDHRDGAGRWLTTRMRAGRSG